MFLEGRVLPTPEFGAFSILASTFDDALFGLLKLGIARASPFLVLFSSNSFAVLLDVFCRYPRIY
jgi:hypothetical protein